MTLTRPVTLVSIMVCQSIRSTFCAGLAASASPALLIKALTARNSAGSLTDTAFDSRGSRACRHSRFSLSNVAFAATTSKLDKERCTARHRDKKREMACRLIEVRRSMGMGYSSENLFGW